ncbi:MAG: hypothetical protein Q4F65_05620 [Propionibacteriaceae bacterium]|nr:hypothetical protein [Propionibacteriaceae bacterium]
MTSYIGPIGGLVAIDCPSTLVSTVAREQVERVTTSGVVHVQVSPRTRRQWRLDWGVATPAELAGLGALVAGEFGLGPFWFVDPWAQVTNLLPPAASTLEVAAPGDRSVGGPAVLPGGTRVGRTMLIGDPAAPTVLPWVSTTEPARVPVVAGVPVTGSLWGLGAGAVQVRLAWYDAAGAHLSSTPWASVQSSGRMVRAHQSTLPVAGAASVMVTVMGASRVARPAITWTDTLMDWHVGQGAHSVVVPADLAQDVILATREPRLHGRLASASTTIREVG